MRLAIGLLVFVALSGCALRDPAGLGAWQRSQQLDRRLDAMERQIQADRWAAHDRHVNDYILNGGAWIPD